MFRALAERDVARLMDISAPDVAEGRDDEACDRV